MTKIFTMKDCKPVLQFCNATSGEPLIPVELFPEHCRINERCFDVAKAVKWMLKRMDDLEAENKALKRRVERLEMSFRCGF